jgi:spore coat protein A, manganese oxidase
MEITRRSLLGVGAAAGAGLLVPLRLPAANAAIPLGVTPFTEALPTLSDIGVIDATKGGTATIRMVNATHRFHRAMARTPTFAYRSQGGVQDYLGPVIVAKRDVPFRLTVLNELGAHPLAKAIDYGIDGVVAKDATAPRAAVHLHGGNTDPASDGDPLDFFASGRSKTYRYGNTQEAAGLWFHDHALGITRLNVFAGLAGGYLIRDANDPGDGALLPAPPYEVPLIVQDRRFNANGTFDYPVGEARPWAPEFFGDVATVNGKAWPNLSVDRGKYRFRVFNGSQARFYNFRFESGRSVLDFLQIGTDGGLLDRPVPLHELLLAPGERADLVVDFEHLPRGARVTLTNSANAPYPLGTDDPLPQIMQFTGTGAWGWTRPLTILKDLRSRTAPITRLGRLRVDRTRSISLVEVHDVQGDPTMVLMNNRAFMDPSGTMTVTSNTLEQWSSSTPRWTPTRCTCTSPSSRSWTGSPSTWPGTPSQPATSRPTARPPPGPGPASSRHHQWTVSSSAAAGGHPMPTSWGGRTPSSARPGRSPGSGSRSAPMPSRAGRWRSARRTPGGTCLTATSSSTRRTT